VPLPFMLILLRFICRTQPHGLAVEVNYCALGLPPIALLSSGDIKEFLPE
jgi:hypothetical protein